MMNQVKAEDETTRAKATENWIGKVNEMYVSFSHGQNKA